MATAKARRRKAANVLFVVFCAAATVSGRVDMTAL